MVIDYLKILLGIIVAILLQYFIIDEINLGAWVKPFPYIIGLLFIAFERNRHIQLLFAFGAGMLMDMLHGTYGYHSAACVAMIYFKIKAEEKLLNTEAIVLQGSHQLTINFRGFGFYALYFLALIAIHHLVFFIFDYYKWAAFFRIFICTLLSTLSTFILIYLIRTYILRIRA